LPFFALAFALAFALGRLATALTLCGRAFTGTHRLAALTASGAALAAAGALCRGDFGAAPTNTAAGDLPGRPPCGTGGPHDKSQHPEECAN
jgi:hypothetical protein